MLSAVTKTLDKLLIGASRQLNSNQNKCNDHDKKTNNNKCLLIVVGITSNRDSNCKKVPKLLQLMIKLMIIDQITQMAGHHKAQVHSFGLPERQVFAPTTDPLHFVASNHTSYIIDPDRINSTSVPTSLSNNHKDKQPSTVIGLGEIVAFDGVNDDDDDDEEDEGYEQDDSAGSNGSEPAEHDEEEEEEDDDDFYSTNPVDSTSGGKQAEKFDDFDDFDALGLNNFYGDQNKKNESNKTESSKELPKNELSPSTVEGLHRQTQPAASKSRKSNAKDNKSRRRRKRKRRRRRKNRKAKRKKKPKLAREKHGDKKWSLDVGHDQLPKLSAGNGTSNQPETVRSQTAASNEQEQQASPASAPVSANSCAMISANSGACVDYQSVEWAIGQARRLIAFRRPGGLSSLEPSESTVHAIGELNEWTSRLLAMRFGLSSDEVAESMGQIDVSQTSLWRLCPRLFRSPWARQCYNYANSRATTATNTQTGLYYQLDMNQVVLTSGRYRSATGQCNNPLLPNLGSSYMPFVRLNMPEYGDGIGSTRRPQAGSSMAELPPARLVSLVLHSGPLDVPSNDLSALFAAWGQLINHDLALASGARVATGHDGSCCSARFARTISQVSSRLGRVCMPIYIDRSDPVYGPFGVRCHDFKRSIAGLRPGCSLGPRTQLNLVSSFVDGSFVYGSTRSTSDSLRSNAAGRGQLATWNYFGRSTVPSVSGGPPTRRKPLLPPQLDEPDEECLGRREGLYCFRSGDLRTNQQVPLVVLHTTHTRQHNRLAQALSAINPHWSAERIYQEARHIHIAQIQHILMREYLPLLLGDKTRERFNLVEAPDGEYWDQYEASLNAGISQEFAGAAFRQGHSTVASEVLRVDVTTRLPTRLYRLRELFRQPWPLFEPGAMDEFLLGLTETASRELDPFVSRELSGHLLQEPNEPVGLDLIAINIQRGRDQGVASYNSMRDWCGLGRLESIDELVKIVGNQSAHQMMQLYESIDDIDLYSGGLSEFPIETAGLLGPTFSCIVGHQFGLLRQADRYWYEASNGPHAFTPSQLASIKDTTLARIICANSDQIWTMQPLAMRLPHPIYNPPVSCQDLPDLDLSLWVETVGQQQAVAGADDGDSE